MPEEVGWIRFDACDQGFSPPRYSMLSSPPLHLLCQGAHCFLINVVHEARGGIEGRVHLLVVSLEGVSRERPFVRPLGILQRLQ